MRFLLFTLYAPMGSFGAIAVGEGRLSWTRPARSAVLGLVAAAQGIERVDDRGHRRLEEGLHYAVRTDAAGRSLMDFHTIQTPRDRKGQIGTFATRREELRTDDPYTVVSQREWRSDWCFTVALWTRSGKSIQIDVLADALRQPRFAVYAGRRSAPLGLPLNPAIIEADGVEAAFGLRQPSEAEQALLDRLHLDDMAHGEIAFDYGAPGTPTTGVWLERRRDAVAGRRRWQFQDRVEGIVSPSADA